jgi:hypothetical protein
VTLCIKSSVQSFEVAAFVTHLVEPKNSPDLSLFPSNGKSIGSIAIIETKIIDMFYTSKWKNVRNFGSIEGVEPGQGS